MAGLKLPKALLAAFIGVVYAYRNPRLMINFGVTRQSSWRNPDPVFHVVRTNAFPVRRAPIVGVPAKKSSRAVELEKAAPPLKSNIPRPPTRMAASASL